MTNLGKMNNCPIFLGRNCCKKVDFEFVNKCPEMLQFISEGPICKRNLSFWNGLMGLSRNVNFYKLSKSHDHDGCHANISVYGIYQISGEHLQDH